MNDNSQGAGFQYSPEQYQAMMRQQAKGFGLDFDKISQQLSPEELLAARAGKNGYQYGGQNTNFDTDSGSWNTTGVNSIAKDLGAMGAGQQNHGLSYDDTGKFQGFYGGGEESKVDKIRNMVALGIITMPVALSMMGVGAGTGAIGGASSGTGAGVLDTVGGAIGGAGTWAPEAMGALEGASGMTAEQIAAAGVTGSGGTGAGVLSTAGGQGLTAAGGGAFGAGAGGGGAGLLASLGEHFDPSSIAGLKNILGAAGAIGGVASSISNKPDYAANATADLATGRSAGNVSNTNAFGDTHNAQWDPVTNQYIVKDA